MHNANMFFQQTSAARMIDHIVTSPNSLQGINHRSCSAQVSRHPEYHYFRQDCDLKNRINHSIIIKIHDLRIAFVGRNLKHVKKKKKEEKTSRNSASLLRGTRMTHGICFTCLRLTFANGKWKRRSGIKYTDGDSLCLCTVECVDGNGNVVHG